MATIYVGPTAAGLADGTSWANRYGSLNAAEDRPITAGSTVYVGPGTYRETLTCDVSGTAGNAITYIGDYTGSSTDGTGGVVRITGAASPDQTVGTRSIAIGTNGKNYRTFRGFTLDGCQYRPIYDAAAGTDVTIDECHIIGSPSFYGIHIEGGAAQRRWTVSNCHFIVPNNSIGIMFANSADVSDCAHVVQNCTFVGGHSATGVQSSNIGGVTVRNCTIVNGVYGVRVSAALAAGQLMTVNNCVIFGTNVALAATTTAEFSEDYNSLSLVSTARSNVTAGANSNIYPYHPDSRWFHEAVNGGTMVTPFDMASYCALVEYSAGTGAPAADLRGATVQGTLREWGALEYDSTLSLSGGGSALGLSTVGSNIVKGA